MCLFVLKPIIIGLRPFGKGQLFLVPTQEFVPDHASELCFANVKMLPTFVLEQTPVWALFNVSDAQLGLSSTGLAALGRDVAVTTLVGLSAPVSINR